MAKILVFNSVSLDGYFTDQNNDMSWAHADPNDAEWNAFVGENASGGAAGGGAMLFGRITYEQMAGFWPTPQAMAMMPDVAKAMNSMTKIVFSRSMKKASWSNTKLVKGDLVPEVRKLKKGDQDMVIMGSGTIVSQLTQARLIDEYQLVVVPIVLGKGRTMFEGVKDRLTLKRTKTRTFKNGNVVLSYERKA
jgi:dihydrofolate reductase